MTSLSDWLAASKNTSALKPDDLAGVLSNINIKPTPNSTPLDSPRSPTYSGSPEKNGAPSNDEEDKPLSVAEKSLLQKIVRKGLIESKQELEIQRKDPHSPLYSVKTFEALHLKPELLKGIYEMGFYAPSKIQETALPTLLADPPHNMVAQSQSGTGKTAAFSLTMLSRVNPKIQEPQGLCLAPTYELAIQIGEVVAKMGKFITDLSVRYAVRGENLERGKKITEQIIIGTPGKVLDWGLKYRFFDLSKLTVFVLDEADVMIATQGHQDFSLRIQKRLSPECQIMLFSATYDKEVMEFAQDMVPNPLIIKLKREEESLDNIKQHYVLCKNIDEKYEAVSNIYGVVTIGQAMIFCHTRKTAAWLAEKLTKEGLNVGLLSGELTVEQRLSILDRFREGKEKVLITTNVLARGIDVEQVTIVINFDLPIDMEGKADCETYLHRIGRTGRFGKSGIAINLVDQGSLHVLKEIEKHFGKKIELLDTEDVDDQGKFRNLAE
ncbi:hypothetical protein WDU94_011172 [Cyamophila willieti]